MRKNSKACYFYLFAVLLGLVFCAAVYIGIVNNVGRGHAPTDSWIPEALQYKHELCIQEKRPKIVIIGGSEAFFSVDSKFLSELTGWPVVNCATHVGIPLRFYPEILEGKVKRGDCIVFSVPFGGHHDNDHLKLYSNLTVPMYWNRLFPQFQNQLDVAELVTLYAQYGAQWVNDSLVRDRKRDVQIHDGILDRWSRERVNTSYGYFFYTMNAHGDRLTPGCKYPCWTQRGNFGRESFVNINSFVTSEFVRSYEQLKTFAKEKGISLISVSGNHYYYPEYASLWRFDANLKSVGVDLGNNYPALAYPFRYYYDTQMHMNSAGARLYTYEIAKVICHRMMKPFKEIAGWPVTVFRERPDVIEGARCTSYSTGALVDGRAFKVSLQMPTNLCHKACVASFLIDRAWNGRARTVKGIRVDGKDCFFEEKIRRGKNEVDIHFVSASGKFVTFDFQLDVPRIGLERVVLDEEDRGQWDFRTGGPYMEGLKGFSVYSYPHGCWSVGTNSLLRLKVVRMKEGADLEFAMSPAVVPNEVEVWTQKQKVAHWLFAEEGRVMQEVCVPAELIPANGIVDLEFRVAKTYCPKEAGRSTDSRHLGLLFVVASQLNFKRPSENQYVITLDMNGGVSRSSARLLPEVGRWQSISAPVRAGYDFVGWKMADGTLLPSALYSVKSGEAHKLPADGSPFGGGKGCSVKGLTDAGKTVVLKAMWTKTGSRVKSPWTGGLADH